MISAAARVTVSARLSGNAFVATSLVNTSVTTSPCSGRSPPDPPAVYRSALQPHSCSGASVPGSASPRRCAGPLRAIWWSFLGSLTLRSRASCSRSHRLRFCEKARQKGFLRVFSKLRNQEALFWTRIAQKPGRCHPTPSLAIYDTVPVFAPKRPQNRILSGPVLMRNLENSLFGLKTPFLQACLLGDALEE